MFSRPFCLGQGIDFSCSVWKRGEGGAFLVASLRQGIKTVENKGRKELG